MKKIKLTIILGPTASGKSKIAHKLALQNNAIIIGADSMQIYKFLNIGTAKPTKEEMKEVEYKLIDYVEPDINYSVFNYVNDATYEIELANKKNKKIIIVGGTGLYLKALLFSYNLGNFYDENLRQELELLLKEKGKKFLYDKLGELDKEEQKKLSVNDTKKIIRALEIIKLSGKSKTQYLKEQSNLLKFDALIYGFNPDRQILYDNINKRVDYMVEKGLFNEVKNLMQYKSFNSMQAIGYKQIIEYYLNKNMTQIEVIENIKKLTRNYAKRQITFFKKFPHVLWNVDLKEIKLNG